MTGDAVDPFSGAGVAATVGGESSTTRLLPVSATKTSPAASTATPSGSLNPKPMGRMVPLGSTSLTVLLPVSATKTSPAASTATPDRLVEPGADGQYGAVRLDLLDGVVAGVGDKDVAGRVHRHA